MTARPRRSRAEKVAASAWAGFWQTGEGKAALGLLFTEFGLYSSPGPDADLSRAWGQRDVLVRITQLINLKPEQAPDDDRDASDILDKLMRTNV